MKDLMMANTAKHSQSRGEPRWKLILAFGGLVAFLIAMPFVAYQVFLMKVLCYGLFACAFNLLFGYAGLMSFGHAAFFGAGSYAAAWSVGTLGLTPELSLSFAVAVGLSLGLLFGVIALRLQGMAFAMVTLALAQLLFFLLSQAPFTGRENGLINNNRGAIFGLFSLQSDLTSYIFASIVFLAAFLFLYRIVHSPFGQVLRTIRDNEVRARSLGYDVFRYKLVAFMLSAALAAAAGALKALVLGLATLEDAHFLLSGQAVLMTLIGGVGTLFGPLVGALFVTAMHQYLAGLGTWVTFIQGGILVACVLLFRRGVVGEYIYRARRNRKTALAQPPGLPTSI